MATYWQTRAIEEEARQHELTKNEMKKIEEIYDETIMNLDKDVNYWLTKFANVEGISLADAKEKLSKGELDKFRMQLKDYIEAGERLELDGSMINDMKKASSLYHIDRLEAMKIQAKYHVSTLGKKESTTMEEFLKKNYKESYYRGAFDIQQGVGFGSKIYALNPDLVESVVKKPWTMDGHNFSSRVWSDKDALLNKLQSTLTQTFIKGDNVTKVADEFAKHMETSKSNAIRILRTEANASQSKARKSVYDDLDVEDYEIVATLDTRTSKVCQELDGKKFKAKDYEVGVTANPFHPYCRTTTAPFFEDDEDSQRAAKDDNGNTYEVPANMKYGEWKDKHIIDKPEKKSIIKIGDKFTSKYKKQEAFDTLRDEHGIEFKDSKKTPIDESILSNITEWVDRFSSEYPDFIEKNGCKIPLIEMTPYSQMKSTLASYRYYTNAPKVEKIRLNSRNFNDLDLFKKLTERSVALKHDVANATVNSTFIHEYGHHVSNSMRWMTDNSEWERDFMRECLLEFREKMSRKLDVKNDVSEYAKRDVSELFAEAFAEYYGGTEPREFAKIFGDKLDKKLKEVK